MSDSEPTRLTIGTIEAPVPLTPAEVAVIAAEVIAQVERVIVGKREAVTLAVAVLLAEGHLWIEDVPGVAKTMLARAVALSTGCSFKRIQCTPDLQPTDVLGAASPDPETGRTDYQFGPLFAQVVLVDEINRANPRTQAALLEAMGEASVTAGRVTYRLPAPFMVIATQNPVDQEGTFRLPEAQRDRFLLRLSLGYPSLADEKTMCERFRLGHPIESLQPVTSPEQILKCQETVRAIQLEADVSDAILKLVRATREHPSVLLGASPRGSLGLFRLAQAMTAMIGSETVSLAKVWELAEPVLAHRLIVRPEQAPRYRHGGDVIRELVAGGRPA